MIHIEYNLPEEPIQLSGPRTLVEMATGLDDLGQMVEETGLEPAPALARSNPQQMAPDDDDQQEARQCQTCGKEFPQQGIRLRNGWVLYMFCTKRPVKENNEEKAEILGSPVRLT